MSKFKVGVFLYILIGAMNLSISYSDYKMETETNEIQVCTEINR